MVFSCPEVVRKARVANKVVKYLCIGLVEIDAGCWILDTGYWILDAGCVSIKQELDV